MKVSSKHLILGGAVVFMVTTALMMHAVTTSVRNSAISTMEKVQTTYTFISANRAARYFGGVDVDAEQLGITSDSLKELSQSSINTELKKTIPSIHKDHLEKIERAEQLVARDSLDEARNADVVDWLQDLQMKAFMNLFTTDAKYDFPSAPAALFFRPMWILGFMAAMASCFAIGWGVGMRRREPSRSES